VRDLRLGAVDVVCALRKRCRVLALPVSGAVIDKDELTAYMRAALAPHKTPKHWLVVDAFPLTGSGKIQKFKLREAWIKGEMMAI
jgi:fatty-acyl-CoA synthase